MLAIPPMHFVWMFAVFVTLTIEIAMAEPWVADTGGGTYRNLVLFAD